MWRFLFLLTFLILSQILFAQTKERAGWMTVVNNTALSKRVGLYLDMQVRTGADWQNIHNALFRTGISYRLNSKSNLLLGYLLNDTYLRPVSGALNTLTEHQIFEQFIYRQSLRSATFTHRLRVGQRFIEQPTRNVFSQSCQYLLRAMLPVSKQEAAFENGLFIGLQDEVFFNVQNKEELNGSCFDQNRAFAALGYRLNPKVDIEAGYLNHEIKGRTANASNNIIQMVLYTRF